MHTKQFDTLPFALRAEDIAQILDISRAAAYGLLRRQDFPVIRIGRRKIVPRDRFFEWVDRQLPETSLN